MRERETDEHAIKRKKSKSLLVVVLLLLLTNLYVVSKIEYYHKERTTRDINFKKDVIT